MKSTLANIARASKESGLECLLIGGHAVILSGVPRFTRDIDLLVRRTDLDRWSELLTRLGYSCFHKTGSFAQFENDARGSAPVDLMLVEMSTWDKLWPTRRAERLDSATQLDLPSPAHLVAIKLAAYRDSTREGAAKDWDDVVGLIAAQRLDLEDPELRDLVIRYGGEDALRRLEEGTTNPE